MSEEEVQKRWADHIELIRAVKRRKYLQRMGIQGETLGLGDAVIVAKTIEKTQKELRRELGRELRLSPLKGRRSQTAIERQVQREQAAQQREHERQFNPRFKAKGVEGLTPDADGYVRLQDAKKARPDLFNQAVPMERRIANRQRRNKREQPSD